MIILVKVKEGCNNVKDLSNFVNFSEARARKKEVQK